MSSIPISRHSTGSKGDSKRIPRNNDPTNLNNNDWSSDTFSMQDQIAVKEKSRSTDTSKKVSRRFAAQDGSMSYISAYVHQLNDSSRSEHGDEVEGSVGTSEFVGEKRKPYQRPYLSFRAQTKDDLLKRQSTAKLNRVIDENDEIFGDVTKILEEDFFAYDFSGLEGEALNNEVRCVLERAPAGSHIQLPEKAIKLPAVSISCPITITGLPGTTIEVTQGSISIDCSSYEHFVHFGELTFIYNLDDEVYDLYEQEKDAENLFAPLFVLHGTSHLEVRDCRIKSIVKTQEGSSQISTDRNQINSSRSAGLPVKAIKDVCFWLRGSSNESVTSVTQLDRRPVLVLKSCVIYNFYACIKGGVDASLYCEGNSFLDFFECAISLINPIICHIEQGIFERTVGNTVQIRFLKRVAEVDVERKVVIKKVDMTSSCRNGISISAETKHHQPINLAISIRGNQITGHHDNAIFMKNLRANKISISKNQIHSNFENGVYLQNVDVGMNTDSGISPTSSQVANQQMLRVHSNKICDSQNGTGLILEECGGLLEANEVLGNFNGGIKLFNSPPANSKRSTESSLDSISQESAPLRTVINKCVLANNNVAGIIVENFWKGNITVVQCEIRKNFGFGISLLMDEDVRKMFNPQTAASNFGSANGSSPLRHSVGGGAAGTMNDSGLVAGIAAGGIIALPSGRNSYVLPMKHSTGSIQISHSKILSNKADGIVAENYRCSVSHTYIQDNLERAIHLRSENSKNLLFLKDLLTSQLRDYIEGPIGGRWGNIHIEKKGVCSKDANNCAVF